MARHESKTILPLAACLCLALVSNRVFAQEDTIELDRLLVTARLQPISIKDVASSVTVISREEIEQKQFKYLSEVLRDVPGFSVSQAGGPGSQTQVRVRGAEANQVLVLIDGVRANDPAASGEFQYQLALTADIERIEIIRGPQSATWGSDAMAGVINIIRRRDVNNQYVSGIFEAGSFDSINVSADGGYANERFSVSGGIAYLDSGGTNISREGNETDGADNTTGNIALVFNAAEALSLRLTGLSINASNDFDDIDYFVTGLPQDADRVTESNQNFLSGELAYDPKQKPFSSTFSLHWMNSDNKNFADGLWSGSTAADTMEYRLRGNAVMGEKNNHRLGFSIEYEKVNFSQRGEASVYGDPNQDQSYDSNGYAIEYVGTPATGLTWTLSGRLDDYSDFANAATWQLAASYQSSPGLRLHASVGTGSKVPTFTERYGFYEDLFIGNPDLKPESSRGWEIGLNTDWSEGRYQLQLAYFDQDLQDEIDGFVFDPGTFLFTAKNRQSNSRRKGLEAVFDTRLGQSFSLKASFTYTNASEKDDAGRWIPEARRPKNMASLSANYAFSENRASLNLNLNYNGPQQDVYFSPVTFVSERVDMPAYTVLDLAAAWKLTRSLELTGRISNLLDQDYEEILGFVRPGRALYAGLRGRFDL